MNSTKHIVVAIFFSIVIVAFGTVGYMLIEGWNFLDALYMTVITYFTVGYSEVHAISDIGRLYTIFLIFLGVGFFLYVAGAVIQFMVEGKIRTVLGRRKLDRQIHHLKNHYIVCGYGRIGKVICDTLNRSPIDLVVIESNEKLIPEISTDKILYLWGDASNEALLLKAGIQRAKGLVAALGTDAENVFLVLTARQLAPSLFITARASDTEVKNKLRAAGADNVESPYEKGAMRMAQRIMRPTVTTFLDLAFESRNTDIQMEEIPISPDSSLNDIILKDSGIRQNFNLIIIAIKKPDGSMLFNPSFEAKITSGDTVVAVGESKNLQNLTKVLNPS
ncbi:MAG: potassium channel protein [Desulfobacterales bacterium]|nr:potassium channel protein [Desulfobacterales bacterium]MDX2513152.1 potassium channel protein [Desulfobacterales bacterium]